MSPAAAPAAKEQPGTAQPAPKPRPRDRKKSRARIGELGRFQRALRFLIPLCVAAVWTEVAGLLLACVFFIIRALTDTTIWSEEDLAKQYDIPVLGSIPMLAAVEKQNGAKE